MESATHLTLFCSQVSLPYLENYEKMYADVDE